MRGVRPATRGSWPLSCFALAACVTTAPNPTKDMPEIQHLAPQSPDALIGGESVALAYSGFRRGQHPDRGDGDASPTPAQVEEDLRLLNAHGVRLIRLYDSGPNSALVLDIIENRGLPMKAMLGAWLHAELSAHETCAWLTEPIPPEQLAANRARNVDEVRRAIELANRHPKTVVAVNVGNEALVTWNDHLVSIEAMVGYIKRVKDAIAQPVSTADNYVAWADHGPALMSVADFALVHTYPVWEGKTLEEAMAYTQANLGQVHAAIPNASIAIGEAGWPTVASEFGDRANEPNQTAYVAALLEYGRTHNITVFVFEAFDEDWKGDDNPDGAEKHWGLFDIDRRPKAGVASGQLLPRPAP